MSNNTKKKTTRQISKTKEIDTVSFNTPIEEKVDVVDDIIEKSLLCDAVYLDGFIHINFKGFGITVPNTDNHTESKVMVYYTGSIGSPNFKFRV